MLLVSRISRRWRVLKYPYNIISMVFWQLGFSLCNFKFQTPFWKYVSLCNHEQNLNQSMKASLFGFAKLCAQRDRKTSPAWNKKRIILLIYLTVSLLVKGQVLLLSILVFSYLEVSSQFSKLLVALFKLNLCYLVLLAQPHLCHFLSVTNKIWISGGRIWIWLQTQLTFWRDKVAFEFKSGSLKKKQRSFGNLVSFGTSFCSNKLSSNTHFNQRDPG